MMEQAQEEQEAPRHYAVVKVPYHVYHAIKEHRLYEQEPLWHVIERALMGQVSLKGTPKKKPKPRKKPKKKPKKGRKR